MDNDQLEANLQHFSEECARREHPLKFCKLNKADYANENSQCFLEVTADWVEPTNYLISLNFLMDILWMTTDIETREQILAIIIRDKDGNLVKPTPIG